MYLDIFDILITGQWDICKDKNICRWHKCYFKVKYKHKIVLDINNYCYLQSVE